MYSQEEITKAHGPYLAPESPSPEFIAESIQAIESFPAQLRSFFDQLQPEHQLSSYREGGWSYRQVIHHLADSHFQAFGRFKLALTEDNPTIKPYIQNAWAATNDSLGVDASHSVLIIEGIHARWVHLLKTMTQEDFNQTFFHPDMNKNMSLWSVLGLYAWHGKHHLTQITRHASNMGWANTATR